MASFICSVALYQQSGRSSSSSPSTTQRNSDHQQLPWMQQLHPPAGAVHQQHLQDKQDQDRCHHHLCCRFRTRACQSDQSLMLLCGRSTYRPCWRAGHPTGPQMMRMLMLQQQLVPGTPTQHTALQLPQAAAAGAAVQQRLRQLHLPAQVRAAVVRGRAWLQPVYSV